MKLPECGALLPRSDVRPEPGQLGGFGVGTDALDEANEVSEQGTDGEEFARDACDRVLDGVAHKLGHDKLQVVRLAQRKPGDELNTAACPRPSCFRSFPVEWPGTR